MQQMSHYEESLEKDLAQIRLHINDVVARIETGLTKALQAVLQHDLRLANRTILGDRAINHGVRQIDRMCHELVVRHMPSAGPLRFVSAVLRLNVALERVGDYAVAMCRETIRAESPPPPAVARDIELTSHQVRDIFLLSAKAFNQNNLEQARTVRAMVRQTEDNFEKIHNNLISSAKDKAACPEDLFASLTILHSLHRVSNQADNICRLTLFTAAGKTKDRKVFRILFVDEQNACLSQMAEGYARRAFPDNGVYESAGWGPADALDPVFIRFMDSHGIDVRDKQPKLLSPTTEDNRHYHIIIGLEGKAKPFLDEVPIRTVLLEWAVGSCPKDFTADGVEAALEESYRGIANEVRELMEMLEGSDPDFDA